MEPCGTPWVIVFVSDLVLDFAENCSVCTFYDDACLKELMFKNYYW